jgi:hypothetical protein
VELLCKVHINKTKEQLILEDEQERIEKYKHIKLANFSYIHNKYSSGLDEYDKEQIKRDFLEHNGYPIEFTYPDLEKILYRERGETKYYLETTPYRETAIKSMYFPPLKGTREFTRGVITDYSWKSRKKFLEKLQCFLWDEIPIDNIREFTLTYPKIFPHDGEIIKTQKDNFCKRIYRYSEKFNGIALVWKLEFQRRGAPHYHFVIVTGSKVAIEELRLWVSENWNEIVGNWIDQQEKYSTEEKIDAKEKHLKAGVTLNPVKSAVAMFHYIANSLLSG